MSGIAGEIRTVKFLVDAGLMYDKPPMTVREKVSGMLYIIIAKWAGG